MKVFATNKKTETVLKHIGIWILITLYLGILDPGTGSWYVEIPSAILLILNYVWVFYALSLFFLPRLLNNRNWFIIPFVLILLCATFIGIDFIIFSYVIPGIGGPNYYESESMTKILQSSVFAWGMTIIPAFGYYFNRKNISELKKQNEREKSLMMKELNFLKNQFHSHITFNFLNFCYNNIHKHSMETAEAIEIFSNMLRYSMEMKPEEKALLVKEINYIKDFIEMQKVLTSNVYVDFNCKGNFDGKFILPRVLITFVENAFKHGVYSDPNNPISIHLESKKEGLDFTIKNKKTNKKDLISSKVGQENVKNILELYYPKKYNLDIRDNKEEYFCRLNLNYN